MHVGFHQIRDRLIDSHKRPGVLRVVVHENVVALLRVLPKIKDLRNRRDIFFGTLPTKI